MASLHLPEATPALPAEPQSNGMGSVCSPDFSAQSPALSGRGGTWQMNQTPQAGVGRVRAYMGMGRAAALPATFRGKKTPPQAQLLRAQGCPDLQFQWGLHVAWRSPACTLPFCGLACMKGLGAAVSRWGKGAHLPAEGHDVLPESLGLTLICLPPLLHMHTFSAL